MPHFTGPLYVDGVLLASTDVGVIDGITPGTAVASKALVLNSSKGISTITSATITTLTSTTVNAPTTNVGADASAGTLSVFPATTASGKLTLTVSNAAGATTTNINVAAQAGARTYTVPDAGASSSFVMLNGVATMAAGSNIITDKAPGTCSSNAVTISKQSGVVTTESLTTAGGASQAITITNTLITTASVVLCQLQGGSNNATKNLDLVAVPGNGSVVVTIYNLTASTALNGTLVFGFLVV